MTVMEFFGCFFIAFGPPFAIFYYTVTQDPIRIIIFLLSAFFWLISLFLSSLCWALVTSLKKTLFVGVLSSVIIQQLMRFLTYIFLQKADKALMMMMMLIDGKTSLFHKNYIVAYVSGLGFGVMSGVFLFANILADSYGPGTVGLQLVDDDGGSPIFFIVSAITTFCFILLHVSWNVVFHAGMRRKSYKIIVAVFVSHLVASLLTFLNKYNLYWMTILVNYIHLLLVAWTAFRFSGSQCSDP